jgi:hypothetical protein
MRDPAPQHVRDERNRKASSDVPDGQHYKDRDTGERRDPREEQP